MPVFEMHTPTDDQKQSRQNHSYAAEQNSTKQTLLQTILDKVTNLRSESDPRKLFNVDEVSSYDAP